MQKPSSKETWDPYPRDFPDMPIPAQENQQASSWRLLRALDEAISKFETITRAKTEPIAVIGIGSRFPGGANDPDSFWKLLQAGVDAIRQVPSNRWKADAYYDPESKG